MVYTMVHSQGGIYHFWSGIYHDATFQITVTNLTRIARANRKIQMNHRAQAAALRARAARRRPRRPMAALA